MDWKNVLYLFLSIILPMIYQIGIANNPSFPLSESQFINTVIWIIGAIVGGWNLRTLSVNWEMTKKTGKNYVEFIKEKGYSR